MTQTAEHVAERTLAQVYAQLYPAEVAAELSKLKEQEILSAFERNPLPTIVRVFMRFNPDIAVHLIEQMDEDFFTQLFGELDPVHAALLLSRLDDDERESRLQLLPSAVASELRELMSYPADTAGRIMDPSVIFFRSEETVEQALVRLRQHRHRRVTDLCLVDEEGHLQAQLSLQEVAVAEPHERLDALVQRPAISVETTATRETVVDLLETRKLSSLPVIDFEGRLVGIIRYAALVSAAQVDASEDIQAMVGAGRGERALSKASFVIAKRLPWLQINLATAFLAASVVGAFEETIGLFTSLAIFLPVVAGQSGNTGAQALAVTMRGLALREIRLRNWPQVVGKELIAGFVNGIAVAIVTGAAAYWYTESVGLVFVLVVSMVFSMMMAALAGATIPVVLTALRQDPAQSASIILTTVTDVVGFLTFLGLATLLYRSFGLSM